MENEKNNSGYDNESYLGKRENPVNSVDSTIENTTIEPVENMNDNKPETDRKKSGKSATPFILGGVILLLIIGVAGAFFISKKITPGKENPQQIIKASTEAMQKLKTYSYNGTMELEIENRETSENFNFRINILGKDDIADINNIKSSTNLKLVADMDMDGGSQEFSFDLDAKQFGQKKTYLKINDFDLGMLGMMLGPEVNAFKEKWYKLDMEELAELSASATGEGDTSMTSNMPTYDLNKIMELYNKYELLKFKEDLGDVKIENIDAYHYKVELDGIALADFYMEVAKEMIAEMGEEDKTIAEKFNEIRENIQKYDYVINKITDNINVEIWIGKDDKLIYRTKIYGEFDKEFVEMIGNEMIAKGDMSEEDFIDELNEDADGSIAFYADIRMSDFNQPVEINEPEEAENLVEVLTGMLGGFMGASPISTGLDTDMDGLSDEMETIYGTDPNKSDTDGDGFTDGEEVESGFDPLIPGSAKLNYEELL